MTVFADLSRPLALLRLLAADHPDLPTPDVQISPIYPERLRFSFHGDLSDFETWREALAVDPQTVSRRLQSGDTTVVLQASTTIADAHVELVGYSRNVALLTAVA